MEIRPCTHLIDNAMASTLISCMIANSSLGQHGENTVPTLAQILRQESAHLARVRREMKSHSIVFPSALSRDHES